MRAFESDETSPDFGGKTMPGVTLPASPRVRGPGENPTGTKAWQPIAVSRAASGTEQREDASEWVDGCVLVVGKTSSETVRAPH